MENLQVSDNDNVEATSPKNGRGQYERKARGNYQKHKLGKKITVKYFPNKRLKPLFIFEGVPNYPIYIQVSVKGQTTQLPATIFEEVDTPPQDNLDYLNTFFEKFLKLEKHSIECIINALNPFQRDDFNISEFAEIYKILYKPLSEVVKQLMIKEVNRVWEKYKDSTFHNSLANSQFFINSMNNMSDDLPLSRHYRNLLFLKDTDSILKEFGADIWNIEHFESITLLRRLDRYERKALDNFLFRKDPSELKMIFSSYLSGYYQEELIEEFGKSKMIPMLRDIDLLFKTFIENYEKILLIYLPK